MWLWSSEDHICWLTFYGIKMQLNQTIYNTPLSKLPYINSSMCQYFKKLNYFEAEKQIRFCPEVHKCYPPRAPILLLSVRTHVCGLRHPTADLRQRIFPSFSFMFGCLHVSDSDLRHPTPDVRQRFFRSGTEKIRWQVNLDECRQNNGKVETKFAIANWPSDVVSRIHVYVDLAAGLSL